MAVYRIPLGNANSTDPDTVIFSRSVNFLKICRSIHRYFFLQPFMQNRQTNNKHLLWRAGFGPLIENITALPQTETSHLLDILMTSSSRKPDDLVIASGTMDGLIAAVKEEGQTQKLTKEQNKQIRKKSGEDIRSLNLLWVNQMVNSEAQVREKMSLFWHGHFACRVINIFYQQQLLNVIRRNALGNFGDLLREVSKTPAMLSFLNNQQNRKQHPNENFAREVMELFTMGRGNYTEEDIKESARAYTGWGFTLSGEFVDRRKQHVEGQKTFLGKTGNFDGDDIIDIILEQRATARFITRKIYSFFVNENVSTEHVNDLAEKFYQSNYNIAQLLKNIFSAAWFYDKENVGSRIKSPVELIAGIQRILPMQLEKPEMQLLFQRSLGQLLFYPPNVAGWPGGKSWIDSSSLIFRMRLPQIMTMNNKFTLEPRTDDDVAMGKEGVDRGAKVYQMNAVVEWQKVNDAFRNVKRTELLPTIADVLYQTRSRIPQTIINRYADDDTREDFIRSVFLELMSTPEYQLC